MLKALILNQSHYQGLQHVDEVLAKYGDPVDGGYAIPPEKVNTASREICLMNGITLPESLLPPAKSRPVSPPVPPARPAVTVTKALSFARAVLTGRKVSAEVAAARTAICEKCDRVARDDKGMWCGVCGCPVSAENKRIKNLAAYEENLPAWGCKHPRRADGKGWPTYDRGE